MTIPIQHKFYQTNFGNGFETHNAILDVTPYRPEVMIIGTFNPATPNANFADFFYGRNFFWTGLMNLFIHNKIELKGTRMPKNGKPKKPLNPDLDKIKEMCQTLKLTFADLIIEVLNNESSDYHILDNDNVCFNNRTFNLIKDDKKGQIDGLVQLHKLNQVKWNTNNIIKYLCENPTIKTVYFTRKANSIWLEQWSEIIKDKCLNGVAFTNIFTPSGQGKPVLYSMARLLNHWVHNSNPNFGQLDNNWLFKNGVNLNNF